MNSTLHIQGVGQAGRGPGGGGRSGPEWAPPLPASMRQGHAVRCTTAAHMRTACGLANMQTGSPLTCGSRHPPRARCSGCRLQVRCGAAARGSSAGGARPWDEGQAASHRPSRPARHPRLRAKNTYQRACVSSTAWASRRCARGSWQGNSQKGRVLRWLRRCPAGTTHGCGSCCRSVWAGVWPSSARRKADARGVSWTAWNAASCQNVWAPRGWRGLPAPSSTVCGVMEGCTSCRTAREEGTAWASAI